MFDKKIDKLQKEVDQLLQLCSEGGADELLDDYPSTEEATKHERIGVMALKMQDGVLEPRYVRRMEKWLLLDQDALRYYIDFQNLSAMLQFHFNKNRFTKVVDFVKGCFTHA